MNVKEYYNHHPDKFIEDYLGIKLTWYQKAMLKIIDKAPVVYPRYQGRHDAYEQMELMRKILGIDMEE